MDSCHSRPHACRVRVRRGRKPQNRNDRPACPVRRFVHRCGGRLLLPCARRPPPSGWTQAHRLQHHVWAAHLCAAAVRCRGHAGSSRQPARTEKTMSREAPQKHFDVADTALLPRDPHTGEALPPRPQPGYYAGFSTLAQQAFWDDATRKAVTERVGHRATFHFFNPAEVKFWTTVFDHLIPQSDRRPDRRIPILPTLDRRL